MKESHLFFQQFDGIRIVLQSWDFKKG